MADLEDPFETTAPAGNPGPLPYSWEPHPGKHENTGWWLLIGGSALLLACLFMLGVVLNGIQSFMGENARRDEAGETIDRFMNLMKDHHEEEAYNLFSIVARQETSLEDLKKMNNGSGYNLVQGYRRIEVKSFQLNLPSISVSGPPRGRTATVTGQILYNQHESGQFEATLEEEGDDWKLLGINISPVPDWIS